MTEPMQCNAKDHADAARSQALAEVEQLLYFRWRAAWDEWSKLVPSEEGQEPTQLCRQAWARMEQAMEDFEAVAAYRKADAVATYSA